MSLTKVPTPFITLRQYFHTSSCRYPRNNNNNKIIKLGNERFLHQAYIPVILQHAMLSSPVPSLDGRYVEEVGSKDGHMLLFSRKYATASRIDEPGTSRVQTVLAAAPSPSKLPPDEEIELLHESEARLSITERAAAKLSDISTLDNDPNLSVRVAVESGGCHGYQYKLELTSEQSPDDYRFVHPKHRNATILIDAVSLGLLKGSTLDYATELIGSSFRIIDNPQAKAAGCGCGISWEAKF